MIIRRHPLCAIAPANIVMFFFTFSIDEVFDEVVDEDEVFDEVDDVSEQVSSKSLSSTTFPSTSTTKDVSLMYKQISKSWHILCSTA